MVRCHRTVSQLTNEAVNADLTTASVIGVPVVVVLVLAEFSIIGIDITLQPRVVRTRGMNHNTLNGDFATCLIAGIFRKISFCKFILFFLLLHELLNSLVSTRCRESA